MKYDLFYRSVFPILQLEESGAISLAGTAVLIKYKGISFLVTAAHVLRQNGIQNPLYLSLENENVKLEGPACMSKDIEVELDLAIFDLRKHANLYSALDGYKTISLEEPAPKSLPTYARAHFFIFGFPWRKAKHNKKESRVDIKPLAYTTDEVSDATYSKYSWSPQKHLLVKYKPKNTTNQQKIKTTAPSPHGASGGPVFKVLVDENDCPILFIFEGIMIEWKGKEVIVATRKTELKAFIEGCL